MNNAKIKLILTCGWILIVMIGIGTFVFYSEYSWLVKTLSVASEVLLLEIAINQFYKNPVPILDGPIYLVVVNELVSWWAWGMERDNLESSTIIAWAVVVFFLFLSVLYTLDLIIQPKHRYSSNNTTSSSNWGGSRPMSYYRGRDDGNDGGWWGGDSGGGSSSCGGD